MFSKLYGSITLFTLFVIMLLMIFLQLMYLCQNRFGCVPGKIEIEIKGGTLAPLLMIINLGGFLAPFL